MRHISQEIFTAIWITEVCEALYFESSPISIEKIGFTKTCEHFQFVICALTLKDFQNS